MHIRSPIFIALALACLAGCSPASGEPVSDAERSAIREGMTYDELVAAIGGEPRESSSGSTPDGQTVATYVSPMESAQINLNFMFRDGRLERVVEVGRN